MKTLIVQSYRNVDVAPWITRCLESVRAWAAASDYAYEFVDDRLFDFAPTWVRQRCGAQILPVTDIARLYLLRDRLRAGWDRVIWVDADVVVFAPDRFVFDDGMPYTLCRELWLYEEAGDVKVTEWVNNAVVVMTPGQPLLDFWLFAAEEIVRTHPPGPIGKLLVGTWLLTDLARAMPLRVIDSVGLFSPPIIRDLARGGGPAARTWAQRFGHAVAAANLCASLQDREVGGARVDESELARAVEVLLKTRGAVLDARPEPARAIGVS